MQSSPSKLPGVPGPHRKLRFLVYALVFAGAAWGLYHLGRGVWASYQYRTAVAAAAQHDYNLAGTHVERYLLVRPNDAQGWMLAARTARQQGVLDLAGKFLAGAKRLGAPDHEVELENRLLVVQSGNLSTADKLLAFCASNSAREDVPLILQALAEGALLNQDLPHARAAANLWLKIRTNAVDQAQGHLWLGQAEKLDSDNGQTIDHYQRAVDLAPDFVRARIFLVAMLVNDQPERARIHLQWLRRRRPDDPEVLFQTARLHRHLGETEKALVLLDQVLKSNPKSVTALVERARISLDLLHPVEAEPFLRTAIDSAPDHRQVNVSLADCLRQQGRPVEAKVFDDRAEEIDKKERARLQPQGDEIMTSASPSVPAKPPRGRGWVISLVIIAIVVVGGSAFFFWPRTRDIPSKLQSEGPVGPALFRDVTPGSNVDFTYRNGEEADLFTILESLGGGVGMIDYDGDGLLDLFFTGGGFFKDKTIRGHPCKLYKNLGNWKFRDVTAETGLDKIDFYTHGVAVADIDCDGWPDLLVTGYGQMALFHNEIDQGKRCFVDVTKKAGLQDKLWSTSAGFADLTGSGYPDLYVCHYLDWSFANDPVCPGKGNVPRDVCSPHYFTAQAHALFMNQKDGTFRQAPAGTLRKDGKGLGVILADVNDDGKPDIYVANDACDNFLYLNQGQGKFEEIGLKAGVARDDAGRFNGSMGVTAGDFDGSGRPSIIVANFQGENHALYLNQGRGRFQHNSTVAGVAALGQTFVGFGMSLLDFDNDGWEDLVIANGHVLRYPSGSAQKQLPILMRNVAHEGRRFFKNASRQGGEYFQKPTIGRGLAVGDLDNDGWPDVVFSHSNSSVALLRNEAVAGQEHRWLGVKLTGRKARDLVGTTVKLDDGTRTLTRFVKGGGSYLSSSDPRILFGLGASGVCQRLTVRWSWGEVQHWDHLEPNCYWELHEGRAEALKKGKV